MNKTVGVLGGMGPEATAAFFQELIRRTPAANDQQHLKIVIVNDPKIPDRTEHLLRGGVSPLPALVKAARDLEKIGADLIAIPCNTAHAYYDEISAAVRVPVLNIVSETVRRTAAALGKSEGRVGIMSTRATLRVSLYQPALQRAGFEPHEPEEEVQKLISASIAVLKGQEGWDQASEWLSSAAAYFESQGCGAILVACTELGLVPMRSAIPQVDSLKTLAEATVERALGGARPGANNALPGLYQPGF